jgi:hypothetical protein
MMVTFTRNITLASCVLVACVGDSSGNGGDGGSDASMNDGSGNDATAQDASDASDGATASDGGDPGCDAQSFPDLNAGCPQMTTCLFKTGLMCEATPSACGGAFGKTLECGSKADCTSTQSDCCLAAGVTGSAGCPSVVTVAASPVTVCSTDSSKTCVGKVQVCVSNAECTSGTCQDTVFSFNGAKVVYFGTCR